MRHPVVRVALLAALLVAAPAMPPPPAVAASELAIAWEACPLPEVPARECGSLTVPLDYDEPDGPTISIALARIPATDQAGRIGSLITNPGGPGGSGVEGLAFMYAALPDPLRARFDLVGFDPRGVGQSAPVHCFATVAERTAFFAAIPTVPIGAQEIAARQHASEELARLCGERNADRLPHLSTANVVRDMDRLRQAVGDEQLTYLGSSYGTYLGATYANLFPDQIRAMVLDGVINPPSYTSAGRGDGDVAGPDTMSFLRILSPQGSAAALDQFLTRCADVGADYCPFAAESATATREKFAALMDDVRAEPVIAQGPVGTLTVTYSLVVDTVRGAIYAAPLSSDLAQGLQRLAEGDAVGFLEATHNLCGPLPTEYHNTQEATPASNCVDADSPQDPDQFQEMVQRAEERTSYFGAALGLHRATVSPLGGRGRRSLHGPWDMPTSATILLISRVYDPATPHSGAMAASRTLANARLLTIDGSGHSYFEGGLSTCANETMATYLFDLQLPPAGAVCPEDAPPFSERGTDEPAEPTPVSPSEVIP